MRAALVVFGREPVPGRVKTRLARDVGDEAAAAVYAVLLEHTLRTAAATGLPVVLALAEPSSPRFVAPVGVALEVQRGADLGERMAAAFASAFAAGSDRVVLVGSDAPALRRDHVGEAVRWLGDADVVFGPAGDGGYYLVGQRSPGCDVFAGVPWSSPETLARTLDRVRGLGVRCRLGSELRDVDTAADLRWAIAEPELDVSLRRALAVAAGGVSPDR